MSNDFLGGSDSKASAYNAGDPGSILGLGRSPGEGKGNPLQHSCLENPMDGGAWWATVHWVAESSTTERLHFLFFFQALLCSRSPDLCEDQAAGSHSLSSLTPGSRV